MSEYFGLSVSSEGCAEGVGVLGNGRISVGKVTSEISGWFESLGFVLGQCSGGAGRALRHVCAQGRVLGYLSRVLITSKWAFNGAEEVSEELRRETR